MAEFLNNIKAKERRTSSMVRTNIGETHGEKGLGKGDGRRGLRKFLSRVSSSKRQTRRK